MSFQACSSFSSRRSSGLSLNTPGDGTLVLWTGQIVRKFSFIFLWCWLPYNFHSLALTHLLTSAFPRVCPEDINDFHGMLRVAFFKGRKGCYGQIRTKILTSKISEEPACLGTSQSLEKTWMLWISLSSGYRQSRDPSITFFYRAFLQIHSPASNICK